MKEISDLQAIDPGNLINQPIWFWICIFQFIVLLLLLYKHYKKSPVIVKKRDVDQIKKASRNEINMHELMDNITKAGKLYKQLSRKCHPDKFANNPMQHAAEEIFKEITRSKRNYEQLIHLKFRAIKELNINI